MTESTTFQTYSWSHAVAIYKISLEWKLPVKLFNVLCVYSRSWIPTHGMETDGLIESMMAESSTSTVRRVANGVVETTSSADEDLIDINTEARFDYPDIADKSHGQCL